MQWDHDYGEFDIKQCGKHESKTKAREIPIISRRKIEGEPELLINDVALKCITFDIILLY